jgi:hypothetical protein
MWRALAGQRKGIAKASGYIGIYVKIIEKQKNGTAFILRKQS